MLCASTPAGAAPAAAPIELPPVAGDVDVRDRDLGPDPHGSPLDHVPRR
ncbi:MAG TPA: hypothetical protein VMV46_07860 [Thermoanaerobaculia bacterium]|nr:hypothetical protein [Thermoanaerobaculia bacterium]